jgi:hypothetical protein
VGVKFVKTDDADFATEFGITEFPAILYFEDKEPSIYDGKDYWGSFPFKKMDPNKKFRFLKKMFNTFRPTYSFT